MKILAFDSTARVATVAVCENEHALALYSIDNGRTQSELLLPMAENILASLGLSFSDIDLYAVSVGPGSFTGVRIGASVVKGLAFGSNTPCAAVSTLEALAENLAGLDGYIVPVMDARRSQVYTAIFKSTADGVTRLGPDEALPLTELATRLLALGEGRIYLVGDGYTLAHATLTSLGVTLASVPEGLRLQSAASVARVGYRLYEAGLAVSDLSLSPTYLRMPQAERERLERLGTQSDK